MIPRIIICVVPFLFISCYATYDLPTAKILRKGTYEYSFGMSNGHTFHRSNILQNVNSFRPTEQRLTILDFVSFSRFGLSDRWEIGSSFSFPSTSLAIYGKYLLYLDPTNEIYISTAGKLGFLTSLRTTNQYQLETPLFISYYPRPAFGFTFIPRYILQYNAFRAPFEHEFKIAHLYGWSLGGSLEFPPLAIRASYHTVEPFPLGYPYRRRYTDFGAFLFTISFHIY